jgi:hypothetical protein
VLFTLERDGEGFVVIVSAGFALHGLKRAGECDIEGVTLPCIHLG